MKVLISIYIYNLDLEILIEQLCFVYKVVLNRKLRNAYISE